jgi:hypothetical protein
LGAAGVIWGHAAARALFCFFCLGQGKRRHAPLAPANFTPLRPRIVATSWPSCEGWEGAAPMGKGGECCGEEPGRRECWEERQAGSDAKS